MWTSIECLKRLNFSTVLCTVFISNTHPINRLSKAGAAVVNTISSNKIIVLNTPLSIVNKPSTPYRRLHFYKTVVFKQSFGFGRHSRRNARAKVENYLSELKQSFHAFVTWQDCRMVFFSCWALTPSMY